MALIQSRFLFVTFFFSIVASARWQSNTDVVDLTFAILHGQVGARTDLVSAIISDLANKFNISAETTRIAIVEFGAEEKTLLTLKDSPNRKLLMNAINRTAEAPRSVGPDFLIAARRTSEIAFSTSKSHVPIIAILFTTSEADVLDMDHLKDLGVRQWTKHSVHAVFLAKYSGHQSPFVFLCRFVESSTSFDYTAYGSTTSPSSAASISNHIYAGVRESLASCAFRRSGDQNCSKDDQSACVANASYQLAFRDRKNATSPGDWPSVERYCFKNGSMPCPASTCSPGRVPKSTRIVATGEGSVTKLVVGVAACALGMFVLLMLAVFLVVGICGARRKRRVAKSKLASVPSTPSNSSTTTTTSDADWRISNLPSLTLTPTTLLVQKYSPKTKIKTIEAAKKREGKATSESKRRRSSKSDRSIRLNRFLMRGAV